MRIDRHRIPNLVRLFAVLLLLSPVLAAQPRLVGFSSRPGTFRLSASGHTATIFLSPEDAPALGTAVEAFADDVNRVAGNRPRIVSSLTGLSNADVVLVGTVANLPQLPHLDTAAIAGQWESALTTTLDHPLPGIAHALVVAGSDRRGAAFALFTLSRQMGVSPWYWWADVRSRIAPPSTSPPITSCSLRPPSSIAASSSMTKIGDCVPGPPRR